jgi:hypothetical protein
MDADMAGIAMERLRLYVFRKFLAEAGKLPAPVVGKAKKKPRPGPGLSSGSLRTQARWPYFPSIDVTLSAPGAPKACSFSVCS